MAIGAGLQKTVAIINVVCFYIIGIPIGALLGYVTHLQVKVILPLRSFLSLTMSSLTHQTRPF